MILELLTNMQWPFAAALVGASAAFAVPLTMWASRTRRMDLEVHRLSMERDEVIAGARAQTTKLPATQGRDY